MQCLEHGHEPEKKGQKRKGQREAWINAAKVNTISS